MDRNDKIIHKPIKSFIIDFDDPSVKLFMIHVVRRSLGNLNTWIAEKYGLGKKVKCPECLHQFIIKS